MTLIINAADLVAGRVAAFAAKQALMGEEIAIVNSEKAVITGSREFLLKKYLHRMDRGMPETGPYFARQPDRFLKRMIRGMLPYRQYKGSTAFKRIRCYVGVPQDFKDKPSITVPKSHIDEKQTLKYSSVGTLLQELTKRKA